MNLIKKGKRVMKIKFKKILSIALCIAMMFTLSSAIPVYAAEESADYCKIQNDSGRVSFRINDKFSLSADYNSADENATLLWSIEGESVFIDSVAEKTETGPVAFIHFLGDTNIKLQLISQDGEVLAEDEITFETLPEKTFFEKLWGDISAWFIFSVMLIANFILEPIGSLINMFRNI